MPANVSYEFAKSREKYNNARTLDEKLAALREMRKNAPGHKGGEHVRADISRKIKAVKEQMAKQAVQRKKTSGSKSLAVKKDGMGQIVLVSFPNVGKSTILNALTNKSVQVADYPFTTKKPVVGMADFEGAKIQLVELPGIVKGASAGKASGTELLSIARNADAVVFLFSAENVLKEWNVLKKEFENSFIQINKSKPKIKVNKSRFKGITIAGKKFLKMSFEKFKELLKSEGFHNASVVLEEPTTKEKLEEVLDNRLTYKKAFGLIIQKNLSPKPDEVKKVSKFLPLTIVSDSDEETVKDLKQKMFYILNKILIWTKKPGEEKAVEPIALKKGSTVDHMAQLLHKDFADFKFAKIWGSGKFAGQRVSKDYELKHRDIVEIYS